jgi:hypothetical protein
MLSDDIETVDQVLNAPWILRGPSYHSWQRIKTALVEAQKTPTNNTSAPFVNGESDVCFGCALLTECNELDSTPPCAKQRTS